MSAPGGLALDGVPAEWLRSDYRLDHNIDHDLDGTGLANTRIQSGTDQ